MVDEPIRTAGATQTAGSCTYTENLYPHYPGCRREATAHESLCLAHSTQPDKDAAALARLASEQIEDGNEDFRGWVFSADANFYHATFSANANFSGATFSANAYFNGATSRR